MWAIRHPKEYLSLLSSVRHLRIAFLYSKNRKAEGGCPRPRHKDSGSRRWILSCVPWGTALPQGVSFSSPPRDSVLFIGFPTCSPCFFFVTQDPLESKLRSSNICEKLKSFLWYRPPLDTSRGKWRCWLFFFHRREQISRTWPFVLVKASVSYQRIPPLLFFVIFFKTLKNTSWFVKLEVFPEKNE